MLVENFFNLVIPKKEIEEGKRLKGSIVNYREHEETDDVYSIDAEVMDKGEVFHVQIFVNKEKEYLSNISCGCYYYGACRHIVPVISRFVARNTGKMRVKKTKKIAYEYKISSKVLKVTYPKELVDWVLGNSKFENTLTRFLEVMCNHERHLLYYLVTKGNFDLDERILELLDFIIELDNRPEVKKLEYDIKIKKPGIIQISEKNEYDTDNVICVRNHNLLGEHDQVLTPEFLFERLPEYRKEKNITLDPILDSYTLDTIKTRCIVKFKEVGRKIYLVPEMEIDGKICSEFELLMLNTGYIKRTESKWERIHIKEYRRFFDFLKSKNLEYKEFGFLCKSSFWHVDYPIIPRTWDKVGIKDFNIKGELVPELGDEISRLKINYRINRTKLSDKEIRRIKRTGILRKGSDVYYIKNIEILSEIEEIDKIKKEDILCKVEEYKRLNNIDLKDNLFKTNIPIRYSRVLRSYQREGVEWLHFLKDFNFSGILADDMGLGKTLQTLIFLSMIKDDNCKFLIVAPKSVLYNWETEIRRFLKSTNFLVYDGNRKKRQELAKKISRKKFIITSYGIVKKDLELLKEQQFTYIVLDEAQHIKNDNTIIWKAVKEVNATHRLALTGTPIENSIKNLWAIFEFLMPGYLGEFEKYSGDNGVEALQFKTRPFVFRRTKEEVLKELPEKIERIYKIDLHEKQREIYDELLDRKRKQVIERIKEHGIKRSFFTIFSAITYLREVCDHPELIGHKDSTSGKVEVFSNLLDDIISGNHKVIVFSQFVKMLKVLERTAQEKGIKYEMLTGESKNRKDIIARFNEDEETKIFFISLKAGGEGLNLTAADTVIHIDPWWNPMVERQATDRAYRIGQTKNLNVYKLITTDTIEEKILEIQDRKNKLFKSIIEDNTNIFKRLTLKDIENLFK